MFANELFAEYGREVLTVSVDLSDISSVRMGAEALAQMPIDVFIHNAGAYSIPREKTDLGYDNVFQINFISPYYITRRLINRLKENEGRVVIVGSIAHNYSKTDSNDVDFSTREKASLVYGNAKRHLMFSTWSLCKENGVELILIKAPSLYPYWFDEYDAQIADYAAANGLAYYNFTACLEEIGLDFQTDTYDAGLHLNYSGTVKLCDYFGRILAETHGCPDHRQDPAVSAVYDEKLRLYDAEVQKQKGN